ncbi:HAD family hydrolase [Clostridium senegalense]|uniref:HAD family hydrolase n=1 Tax=Clostridium senegalense TaxID=1465809 RepID=A0A6M0H0N5_9CLOT|nr:HAD family hydrolase [Clostridium senegalense]NEU03441.1 HAD family hydrolase [Clostridium senegalense]
MIKLIASDMDGTLLDSNGILPLDFYSVLTKLNSKGIMFVAASGRQYHNLVKTFDKVKNDIIFAAENGTYIVQNGKELYSNCISKDIIPELCSLAATFDNCYILLCGKKAAYLQTNKPSVVKEIKKYFENVEIVDNIATIDDEILKFTLCDFNGANGNSYEVFNEKYKDKLKVVTSGNIWLDIMNKDANKGVAIKFLQNKLNISFSETMAFGDYYNDLEMLKACKYSYAMGNAVDAVKKVSNYLTDTNEEYGVLKAIREAVI